MLTELALFPLHTVLYPGGPLRLRIFEPRYLDMVGACLRDDQPFGVCLIREGAEAGGAAKPVPVGTTARISDWNQLEDGLLGITATGERRFRVLETRVRSDQLVTARIEPLPDEPAQALPEIYQPLADLLHELVERLGSLYGSTPRRFQDATWVGYRLAELLPVPLSRKQFFLELEDPLERLRQLDAAVRSMAESERSE